MVELLTRKQVKRYSRKWRRAHKVVLVFDGIRSVYFAKRANTIRSS
jgi:hypothetical protein